MPYDTTYTQNLKHDTTEDIHEANMLTDTENRPVVAKQVGWESERLGAWSQQIKTISISCDKA